MQSIRFYIIIGLQLMTFLVGFMNYKSFKDPYLKYFFYFICYSFLGELIALVLNSNNIALSLFYCIYNTYSVVFTVFLGLFFRNYMKRKSFRKLSIGMLVVFIISVILNAVFDQSFTNTLQNNTYIVGFLTVAIIIVFYFVAILNSDDVIRLKKLPHFWIAIGTFIFVLCFVPVLVIARFIGWTGMYDYILLGVNVLMYGCFIKGFLVSKSNDELEE